MASRSALQTQLESLLGSRNVYFQPGESIKLSYPAIVYSLDNVDVTGADDIKYKTIRRYSLKYISHNPDNTMIDTLIALPYCSFDRRFVSDNLYHDCFSLFY